MWTRLPWTALGLCGAFIIQSGGTAAESAAPHALKVAAVQMRSSRTLADNVQRIRTAIRQGAADGARVTVFPECALSGYYADVIRNLTAREIAEAEAQIAAACRQHGVYAIVGAPRRENGTVFNSAVVFSPTGKVIERYDKIQLAEAWPEGGDHLSVFRIDGVLCSIIICHDERYPELVRLPVLAGAQVIFYISHESGLDQPRKIGPYRAQIQARAVENTVYVVQANAPANPDGSGSHGKSRIIAPDGNVIEEASTDGEEVIIQELELRKATRANAKGSLTRGPLREWWQEGVRKVRLVPIEAAENAPYPASPVIASIEWAPLETIVRRAKGSDNFPMTWSDDDSLYTTYGDGLGFEPFVPRKLSLGLARITGMPNDFQAVNLRSESIEQFGEGRRGRKGWGLLSVQGVLYLWMGHADRNGAQAQLAWSKDHGRTWEIADWQFAEFGLVGFVNFGKDYNHARDEFVYAYSHDGPKADTPADRFILMRAPRDEMARREAWEFFVRRDQEGRPVWSSEIGERGAVFEHRDACLRSAITYSAPLKRYLWWQAIPQPPGHKDRGDTRFEGGFGVYDAPEPWGPWTTAAFTRQWDTGPGEHGDFPSKWMSPDGRTMHLVFSGDDHFSVRRATLQLHSPQ